jgi:carbonic anhydrase
MNSQNINISQSNVYGKCDLKCSYTFKYPESNLTAKNNGIQINLTYDNNNSSPVLYNDQKYNVTDIMITCPSIHYFNNLTASAEIIIVHTAVLGGPDLTVGIPIISSNSTSTASTVLTEIIDSVSTTAPSNNSSTNININSFSLQDIVPNKPFFSYIDSTNNYNWIVFGINSAISLNSTTLTTLSQIITPSSIPTPGGNLFFNNLGPNTSSSSIGDGIYISCQPTGESEEETPVSYVKNKISYDTFSSPVYHEIMKIFWSVIVILIVFVIIQKIYSFITNTKPYVYSNTS